MGRRAGRGWGGDMIKRLGEFWRQRRCVTEVDLWCLGNIGNSGLPSWEFIVGCWAPRNRIVETSVFVSDKSRRTCTHSFVHSLLKNDQVHFQTRARVFHSWGQGKVNIIYSYFKYSKNIRTFGGCSTSVSPNLRPKTNGQGSRLGFRF